MLKRLFIKDVKMQKLNVKTCVVQTITVNKKGLGLLVKNMVELKNKITRNAIRFNKLMRYSQDGNFTSNGKVGQNNLCSLRKAKSSRTIILNKYLDKGYGINIML